MTARTLPFDEWSRLDGTQLGPVWRAMDPSTSRVMVVEDEDGAIIGCWSLIPFVHAEGLWIAEDHRAKGVVLRRLWVELVRAANEVGLQSVITSATDDHVAQILVSRGAPPMLASYVLPLDPKPRAADRALGEKFHESLFAQLPAAAQHEDDDAHHAAVGRAMRVGIFESNPKKAERQYNAWALTHGYAPVRFMGETSDGRVMVDIVEAVIAVAKDGAVDVLESRI